MSVWFTCGLSLPVLYDQCAIKRKSLFKWSGFLEAVREGNSNEIVRTIPTVEEAPCFFESQIIADNMHMNQPMAAKMARLNFSSLLLTRHNLQLKQSDLKTGVDDSKDASEIASRLKDNERLCIRAHATLTRAENAIQSDDLSDKVTIAIFPRLSAQKCLALRKVGDGEEICLENYSQQDEQHWVLFSRASGAKDAKDSKDTMYQIVNMSNRKQLWLGDGDSGAHAL
jgi:hypothetical protein